MTVSVSAQGREWRPSRQRMIVLGLVGAGIALFALANLHLVYVAVHSQPASTIFPIVCPASSVW